jgi:hypothetical protein
MSNPYKVGDKIIVVSGMSKKLIGLSGEVMYIDGEWCDLDLEGRKDYDRLHYLALRSVLKPKKYKPSKDVLCEGLCHMCYGENLNSIQNELNQRIKLEQARLLLPTDDAERKATPVYSGVVKYFPRALACVSQKSYKGNQKHNPDTPLHWDRSKSGDELDALMRHLIEEDWDAVAWRALANLEKQLENGWKPKDD